MTTTHHRGRAQARRRAAALVLGLATATGLAGCGGDVMDGFAEVDATVEPTPSAPDGPSAGASPSLPEPSARPERARDKQVRKPPQPSLGPRAKLVIPDVTRPPVFDGPVLGGDVSWPQCPTGMGIPERRTLGLPMPLPEARFVILGLTNGPAFTPNPCLAQQVRWVKERRLMASAYAVHSYPDAETLARYGDTGPFDAATAVGRLRNVGYQQALFNVRTMERAGLSSPVLWLDVEPVPDPFPWSSDTAANAAVVQGAAQGYTDEGLGLGVYSTPLLYETVVGDLDLGGVAEWRAAGQTSQAEALNRCGRDWSIQGGEAAIGQWVEYERDLNITCPGAEKQLFRWFHQY